jgi:hypothetical protein
MVALGFLGFERYVTTSREHASQVRLAAEFAAAKSRGTPGAPPPAGAVFGLLDIPRLGIVHVAVVEGATLDHLNEGPARDSNSQIPGHSGVLVILGHHRTYGAPFAHLTSLRTGDVISLQTTAGLSAYRVSGRSAALHGALHLPSAAAVGATGGNSDHVDQALVLATSLGSDDATLQTVTATLEQATPAVGTKNTAEAVAAIHSVPGQRSGLLLAAFWMLVIGLTVGVARRLREKAPRAALYPAVFVVALLAIFQTYSALDRIVPGTH